MTETTLYTGIVFLEKPNENGNTALKYRGIKNTARFERFVIEKHGQNLTAINYYNKETRSFSHQTKFR